MQEQNELTDDPLRARVEREIRFRPDDPPEVREALIQAALKRDTEFYRGSLEQTS